MRVPLSWLKEYVDVVLPVKELAHRLTMAGVAVEGIETLGGWENCFVGRVLKVEPHPNADRLRLCTVDLGTQQMRVVCGAPNVAEGQKVPFAKVGARLIDPHTGQRETLRAAKIRGVVSEGMICSERELGLGQDHTGIVVLPPDAPVGVPLDQYLGDAILELEVTTNRPDCLSVLGVAREAAAAQGSQVREPSVRYPESGQPVASLASVEIADPDLCPRYTASIITGVKVGPSPRWMQERLTRAGQRPINNVVDITNYVMLELGQPLHAFDYDAVKGHKIVVRRARPGEVLTTLDGVERQLSPDMLVIADQQDAIGIAGVIGGATSETTEQTRTVLLESANFHPINNRRTAQALKLRTEATLRFEKGLRPELAEVALRRATQLILQLTGGQAAAGIIDVYPGRRPAPTVTLTLKRLRQVLGVDFPMEKVEQVLGSLGLRGERLSPDALRVAVPYWRSDINMEDDLVEEVARTVGYDNIPTTMLSTPIPYHQPQPMTELKDRVRDTLAAAGMQEVINYPLTDLDRLEKAGVSASDPRPLRVLNPLNRDQEYMRTSLRPGLFATLASNRRLVEGPLRLFEVGRVYIPRPGDLPHERETLAAVLSGPRQEPSWLAGDDHLDFFDAKGTLEALWGELGIQATFQPSTDPALHPGKTAAIFSGGRQLGIMGELHPQTLEAFDLEGATVAFFELDLEALLAVAPPEERRYQPFSRFPPAIRDVAVVVRQDVPAEQVRQIIVRHPLVSHAVLFDVYTGQRVPQGTRSLAYHIYFQSSERTLSAEEANQALQEIVSSLSREVGATLRS